MKNLTLILGLSIGLFSCTFTSKTHEDTGSTTSKKEMILLSSLSDSKDYSCGMTLHDGNIADSTTYNGKTYGFCAKGCKEEFLKDPEAALKK